MHSNTVVGGIVVVVVVVALSRAREREMCVCVFFPQQYKNTSALSSVIADRWEWIFGVGLRHSLSCTQIMYLYSSHDIIASPIVKWLSLLTLNQASQVRTLVGEHLFLLFPFKSYTCLYVQSYQPSHTIHNVMERDTMVWNLTRDSQPNMPTVHSCPFNGTIWKGL